MLCAIKITKTSEVRSQNVRIDTRRTVNNEKAARIYLLKSGEKYPSKMAVFGRKIW